MTKNIYRIKGMNCDACAKMIELDLEDLGINAKCNYARSTLEVENRSEDTLGIVKVTLDKQGCVID